MDIGITSKIVKNKFFLLMISSLGMAVVTVASDGLFDGKLVCLRGSPRTLATNFYFYFIYPVGVSFCFCSMASKNLFVSLFSSFPSHPYSLIMLRVLS